MTALSHKYILVFLSQCHIKGALFFFVFPLLLDKVLFFLLTRRALFLILAKMRVTIAILLLGTLVVSAAGIRKVFVLFCFLDLVFCCIIVDIKGIVTFFSSSL